MSTQICSVCKKRSYFTNRSDFIKDDKSTCFCQKTRHCDECLEIMQNCCYVNNWFKND